MAEQFVNWKKILNKDYVLKGKTPKFTGANEKLKDHGDEFVEYKKSEEAKKRSAINKKNDVKKEYHHRMGQVATGRPSLSWRKMRMTCLKKE